jgi:predicted AAA+ superfamily ATPase
LTNGELINYRNIASECGVSAPTVKEYFQILEDTLIGKQLPAFRKRAKRRLIGAPKFYFFDIGIVAYLTHRGSIEKGSELFGRVFEHFLYMEILAHSSYSELNYPITYWKTASGFEVDFVLGDHECAIEVKSASMVGNCHLKGMRAFKEEYTARRYIVVSMDPKPRKTTDGIDILPWEVFLDRLWKGRFF